MLTFTCNLCSARVSSIPFDELDREKGLCPQCGANVRVRSIVQLLSSEMLGKSLEIARWPTNRGFVCIGLGDSERAKQSLADKITYMETRFDEGGPDQPFLKIADVPDELRARGDVVACSEVLQHVLPPVQAAFDGFFAMLKPGGLLIVTVPYGFESTVEYFPNLNDYAIVRGNGKTTLRNTTTSGKTETFTDLRFYDNGKLEMRMFGLGDLRQALRKAGFVEITIAGNDCLQYGIQFRDPWSLPITARKP